MLDYKVSIYKNYEIEQEILRYDINDIFKCYNLLKGKI